MLQRKSFAAHYVMLGLIMHAYRLHILCIELPSLGGERQ